ncbi:trypsin-like peptidase domain-containing protein [Ideonella sp. 4Y16]|uniref:Serine protease n=1 Tax=Ideonella alba TaxID=2824118 RepID=A0A940Y733_9BURK|nr:trypsin-like peptidase domain-containing protein [Ideonella alba]MBQ0929983.1 trypsin-like peptidase domain-containing protein [Ideonella alba]MBQ0946003.1 trypsin-like peptidase domain-containing protein [Ideonella alba]
MLFRSLLAAAAACLMATTAATAAAAGPGDLRYELRTHAVDASVAAAARGGQVISADGAPWVRLLFKRLDLQPGVTLRITSLQDGAQQNLTARSARDWRQTSAYFNGAAVRVELIGTRPGQRNRVEIAQIMVGQAQPESQCGPTDDRVASNAANRARLLNVGCTANMMANGCFITAGHCLSTASLVNVVEFNVPPSNSNGSLNHPPPSSQYVPTANRQFTNGGIGNDWGVFTVSPNSETGLTPLQAQGPGLPLATTVPSVGQSVEITGYGVDTGAANQTQQVHSGAITSVSTTLNRLQYKVDTTGGNSGSAVLQGGEVVAIHTHAGCNTDGTGANQGTLFTHPGFQAGYAAVCGGTTPPTCGDVVKLKASCTAGKLVATLLLADDTHAGQTVTMTVDGAAFDVPISANKAKLVRKGQASGNHVVTLTEPASCGISKTVACP